MTTLERFESKFIPEPNSGCWLWTAAVDNCNYGMFRLDKRVLGAHRVSYELYCEEVPNEMYVLHKCDNPICVNPEHLVAGTQQENIHDMITKNRRIQSKTDKENNGRSVLTEKQVEQIRLDSRPQRTIAKCYGVSLSCVNHIKTGRTWK